MIINAMPKSTVIQLTTEENSGLEIENSNTIPQIKWDKNAIFVLQGKYSIES